MTADIDPFLDPVHDAVGGAPEWLGPWQLDLLVGLGLRREHTLLDLGCGTLRGGLHFIRHLEVGRYLGVDVSLELLATGARLLAKTSLQNKLPRLMSITELDHTSHEVDWVLTQSVLNHLDETEILATVRRASGALRPGGQWVSTICFDSAVDRVTAGEPHGRRVGEYWRSLTNPTWFRSVLADFGFSMEVLRAAHHPRGHDVFVSLKHSNQSDEAR
jgi:SAM-dependent methyltransferase